MEDSVRNDDDVAPPATHHDASHETMGVEENNSITDASQQQQQLQNSNNNPSSSMRLRRKKNVASSTKKASSSSTSIASATSPTTPNTASDVLSSSYYTNTITHSDEQSQNSTSVMTDETSSTPELHFDFDILNSVGGIILELVTFFFVIYYNASLLSGGLMRNNYASMFYLVCFLANVTFPSYYPYYPSTPLHRILFITPRVFTYIFTTAFAVLFLITQISLQIVFKTRKETFHPPGYLSQLGFVNLLGKDFETVILNILPDINALVSGVLVSIFLPILWRRRVKLEKRVIELYNEKSSESASSRVTSRSDSNIPNSNNNLSDEQIRDYENLPQTYQQSAAAAAATTRPNGQNEENDLDKIMGPPIAPDLIPRSLPNIFILKELLYLLMLMLVASMYPCFTSAPYMILFFGFATMYTVGVQISFPLQCVVMIASNLYTGGLIIVFALSRFPGVLDQQYNTKFGQMFGFIDTSGFNKIYWPVYTSYALLLTFFVLTASVVNQYLVKYVEYRNYIQQLSSVQLVKFLETLSSSRSGTREAVKRLLQDFMKKFVLGLLMVCLVITVLSVPSLIAIPYLLLLYLGLLVATDIYAYILPFAYIYSILSISGQYAFNIQTVADNFIYPTKGILERIGFRLEEYPCAVIFGQLALTLLIGLTMRVQFATRIKVESYEKDARDNFIISELNSDEYSYDSDATENLEEDEDAQFDELTALDIEAKKKERKRRPKTFRAWVKLSLRTTQQLWEKMREVSVRFFTTYSYYLSLLVVYFADLTTENADTIHAVYLLFFLLFFVFRSLARRFWVLLITYTQFVIVSLYFFNVFYPDVVGVPYNILGLVRFRKQSYWLGLIWHILILFFTSIEYHVQNLTEFAGIKMSRDYVIKLPKLLDMIVNGFHQLSKVFGLYMTYMAILLLLLLSREASLFGIIFFMLLFVCFILQTYRVTQLLLYPFWYVLMAYSGLVFFSVYIYQFPDVRHAIVTSLQKIDPAKRLFMEVDSIGLVTFRYKSVSLLPYTVILLLSIFQLKNFQFFSRLKRRKAAEKQQDEPRSLMSELAVDDNHRFEIIFSAKIDSILVTISRFFKRLAILHQPKVLFIFLFVAAQLNETIMGLVYFFIVILLAPVPNIASRLWLFIYVYSSSVFLAQYIYQFPYFVDALRCDLSPSNPNEPNPHTEEPHAVCAWFKFGGLRLSKGKFIGDVLWVHCIVLIAALFQKRCFQWYEDFIKKNLYTPGLLFDETMEETREEQIESAKHSEGMKYLPVGVRMFLTKMWIDVSESFKYVCNHLFEDYGYEVCMMVLLIGSLLMIQSSWGFLYLILFGICFFAGEKRISRVWVVLVVFMELNMIVLYFFKLEKFPLFDLYAVLTSWKGSILFRYVVLRPKDFAGGVYSDDFIVSILYTILFFMALQTRVYVNRNEATKMFLGKYTKVTTNSAHEKKHGYSKRFSKRVPASTILYKRQEEEKKLHVECPITHNKQRDFTEAKKRKNWIDWLKLMFVFRGFPLIVLVVVFIDAAIDASFIKLLQMTICLFYLNLLEQLRWKSKRYWRWIGIFYYSVLILQAIYQIPIVIVGEPITWKEISPGVPTKGSIWAKRVLETFGLRKASIKDLWLSILVLALFYIQDKIFDLNPDYLYFLNFLVRQRTKRRKLRVRNKTFRAAQIFRRYIEITFNMKRRQRNMEAIKEYERINSNTLGQIESESKLKKKDEWPNDPKIIKEYLLRDHYMSIHKSYSEDGTLSNKSEREIFRIAFENIRNSKTLQDDIIDRVDQYRMEELYNSSKKQLERQQRMENNLKKRTASDKSGKRKRVVKISTEVVEIPSEVQQQPQEQQETIVSLDAHQSVEQPKDTVAEVKEEKQEELTPTLKQKITTALTNVWQTVRGYIIMSIDYIINLSSPFINIAYGNEDQIVELLTGSTTKSDQKSLLENRESEEKYFNEILKRDHLKSTKKTETVEEDINKIKMDEEKPSTQDTSSQETKLKPQDQSVPDNYANISLLNKLKQLQTTLVNLYLSNTDTIVYIAMVFNVVYSPTVYNVLLTVSAFIYAAMQYPFPPRLYWLIILGVSQSLIALEYVIYLVQKGFLSDVNIAKYRYSSLEIIGWKPRSNLFANIFTYLIVICAVLQHRDTLKKRGDWYYAEESKKKELKRLKREEALRRANEQSNTNVEAVATTATTVVETEGKQRRTSQLLSVFNVEQAEPHQKPPNQRPRSNTGISVVVDKVEAVAVTPEAPKLNIFKKTFYTTVTYFLNLTNTNAKLGKDYFVATIAVQLVAFVLFFGAFPYLSGRQSTDITGAIQSNELSGTFVLVLFLFFVEICVERVIYLYTKLWTKLLFHYLLVIVYHVVYLVMNDYMLKSNNKTGSIILRLLFVIKCLYLAISCVQIRNGYPTTGIYSSFFAKSYFWVQNFIYLGWRAIPFVFELKTLLDWTFIPTTLNFQEWMKMEDIYSELYNRKCDLEYRKILGRDYGQSQFWTRKLFAGFFLFAGVCFLIFFPLAFYSTANPSFSYNSISLIRVSMGVTGFQSFYENQFYSATPKLVAFTKKFGEYSRYSSFSQFDAGSEVQAFNLATYSEVYWIISTPSRENLAKALTKQNNVTLTITYEIERAGPPTAKQLKGQQDVPLTLDQCLDLATMISSFANNETYLGTDLVLNRAFNPYLLNKYDSLEVASRVDESFWPNCTIGLRKAPSEGFYYWLMNCTQLSFDLNPVRSTSGPFYVIQSTMIVKDNKFYTKFISGIGIIAFYTTFVLAVGQFLRLSVTGLVSRIYFSDVDNVDLLLSFVKDVYIARENGALDLEETMYLQLTRIYRDTALLQVWTNINRSTL